MQVLAAADAATGNHGTPTEPFWEHAVRRLLNYAIPLIFAAHGTVSVRHADPLHRDGRDRRQAVHRQDMGGGEASPARTLRQSRAATTPPWRCRVRSWRRCSYIGFSNSRRSPNVHAQNIVASVTTKLDLFLHRGRMKSIFCGKTAIVPELGISRRHYTARVSRAHLGYQGRHSAVAVQIPIPGRGRRKEWALARTP